MAANVARHPLRRDSSPQQLALTFKQPRLPAEVPTQSTPLLTLPHEILVAVLEHLCKSGAGAAAFTLASLQSIAFLSRCCFHLYHEVRAFRPPCSVASGSVIQNDKQWLKMNTFHDFPGCKRIPLFTKGSPTGELRIFCDCIQDRVNNSCFAGTYGALRIFFWPYERYPQVDQRSLRGEVLILELSVFNLLKLLNTSCKESIEPSAVKGSLCGTQLDESYPEYLKADVFLHSPCSKRGNVHDWQLTLKTSREDVYGEFSRPYHINDVDVDYLRDLFNSQLPPRVARCRYGETSIEAFLPARGYGSHGGDVSPQNVLADDRRRSSAQRADRSSHRLIEQLNSLTGAGRIKENGALGEQFRAIQDAEQSFVENPHCDIDDQIARDGEESDDDQDDDDDTSDGEYVDSDDSDDSGDSGDSGDDDDAEKASSDDDDAEASSDDAESSSDEI